MPNENLWGLIALLGAVLVIVAVATLWQGGKLILKRLFGTQAAWLAPLLVAGLGFIFWSWVPQKPGHNPPVGPRLHTPPVILIAAGVIGGTIAFIAFLRANDAGVRRALKRAQEGDREGAIEDLREQIELKGATQLRANVLGILLLQAERWGEAAALFRKAEELGDVKGICRANLGLALLKGGKPDEALPVLREAARNGPQVPALTCLVNLHTAQALAALGRWDEARDQYREADAIVATVPRFQRPAIQQEVESARWIEQGTAVPEEPAPLEGI